jgi:tellurium resistance protein TerD
MSVTLQKGAKVDLAKANTDAGSTSPLTKLVAGAGWDAKDGKSIDLDLVAVLIGSDGKAIPDANGNGTNLDEAVVFFNNLSVAGLQHSGDNLTGEGDGDDEQITVDLASVPANVQEVAIVVASYSGETFGEIENAFVRLVNADGNTELAKYELKDGMANTKGVELGRVKRDGQGFTFEATGKNIDGDFTAIVASYGVTGL